MAALNNKLTTFVKNNNYPDFESEFLKLNPTLNAADAALSFNAHRSTLNSSNKGSSSFSTSSLDGGNLLQSFMKNTTEVSKPNNDNAILKLGDYFKSPIDEFSKGVLEFYQNQLKLTESIGVKTGMLGELSESFRNQLTKAWPEARNLGIQFDELATTMIDLVDKSGRFKMVNAETMVQLSEASVFAESMQSLVDMSQTFQDVSMGVADQGRAIVRIGHSSLEVGLNQKAVTKEVGTNLALMNLYGFQNGVDGLGRMVQRAKELNTTVKTTTDLAEKLFDPSRAVEMTANLQMIGGAFGDFNDPIKLMYMATNDVNGLQEALAKSAEQLTSFNKETGRFEIAGANLRRLRSMTEATGVQFEELSKIAINSAQRTAASAEMMYSGVGFKDEKDKEFLTNLAQMDNGKMVIQISDESLKQSLGLVGKSTLALESMTQDQANILLAQREQLKSKTTEQIAMDQVNILTNVDRKLGLIAANAMVQLNRTPEAIFKKLGITIEAINGEFVYLTNSINGVINKMGDEVTTKVENILPKIVKTDPIQQKKVSTNARTKNQSKENKSNDQNYNSPLQPKTVTHKHEVSLSGIVPNMYDNLSRSLIASTELKKAVIRYFNDKNSYV